MTWILSHNNETIGEWSEDLIDKMAQQIRKHKSSLSKSLDITQNESVNIIAEFLPDPIRDAFLNS
jgi:hypothetical protein